VEGVRCTQVFPMKMCGHATAVNGFQPSVYYVVLLHFSNRLLGHFGFTLPALLPLFAFSLS
jgi:hypothetical protein